MKWRSRLPEPGVLPMPEQKYRLVALSDDGTSLPARRWPKRLGGSPINFMHAWAIAGADTRIALTRIARS